MRSGESVTDAMFGAGYGSTSRLYERAAPMLGMHPSTYRRGGQGTEIRYAIVQSPLGWLLVAATPFGVCAVAMGDSVSALERALAAEYPRAASVRDDAMLAKATRQVLDHLSGKLPRLDLPLDVRATAFEWQVWTALKAIPPGETRTYKEVAESIGHPRAVRAVARACAGNPVALTIPCHRVVPSAGGVGGYRWGTKRKKRLLRQEQVRRE
jgi:AraC family transcriptional regulator of adaptative response/methylated-DNA-[protein]-cysteine methyltransferase